ncbi:MAG: RNA polymerase factor sigma-54 [Alphaproteobacteria bacterium]|nr:RNA polymerase factor sigma-54 [Alphaproteobacteria bacterium]
MPSLQVKQKQSLVMTPQLQQAIKLLQMTNLDIAAFLQEQALDNPFIEFDADNQAPAEAGASPSGEAGDDRSGKTDAVTEINSLDRDMREGAAIADDPTAHADVENRYESAALDYGREQRGRPADTDWDALANLAETGPESLVEFVLRQIDMTIFDPADRVIAYALAEALEPTGWLGRPLSDIAAVCGCLEAEVEAVLNTVQRLEPEGVFARDLAECLRIQARERGLLNDVMIVVLDHLDMLANGDLQQLARRAGAATEDIAAALKLIREMNPKPGEAYEAAPLRVHAPDVIVTSGPDGWVVDLNRSTLPSLTINETYAAAVTNGRKNKAEDAASQFAADSLGSARWLRRALDQRNSTTLKIAGEIIRQQADFLTDGLSALKPLALKDVAEAVGMHESTVSRVTSGLLLATPKGCFPLKSLFSVSLATDEGDSKAAAAVRNMIEAIIAGEPAGKPYSDDAIAGMVSEKGVKLARRTVAKYRDMLKIPSSSERRRRARLETAV